MKEKKTTAQKVAEMSQEQKSNVLRIGIIVDVVAIVLCIIGMLIWLPGYQAAKDARNNAKEISEEISEANESILEESERLQDMGILNVPDLIPYDRADEAWDEADAENQAFLIRSGIIVGVLFVYIVAALVFIKKKFPYYSDGVFYYLLFRKDKKAV